MILFILAGILLMSIWSNFFIADKFEISTTSKLTKVIESTGEPSQEISVIDKENTAFSKIVSNYNIELTQADFLFERVWELGIGDLIQNYGDIKAKSDKALEFETTHATIGDWALKMGYNKKSLREKLIFSFNGAYFTVSITVQDADFGVALMAAYNYIGMQHATGEDFFEAATADTVVRADFEIIDQPKLPEENEIKHPNHALNLLLGALVGVALAVITILMIYAFDVKVKSESDIKERFDIPVIATIPDISKIKKGV